MLISVSKSMIYFLLMCSLVLLCGVIIYNNVKGVVGTYSRLSPDFIWQLWTTGPAIVKQRQPARSKGEEAACRALEELFNRPFTTQRPDFLKSPITGQNLEIDCFNSDLKVGVEYNGRQHYEYTPKFHASYQDFRNSQYRDYIKAELCKQNNVKLIVVPYTVPHHAIKAYIRERI